MRQVTYHGPGRRLRTPSGRTIPRGVTDEVTDADARSIEQSAAVDATVHEQSDEPEAAGEGQQSDVPDEE